jgi:hypothetical protein
MNVPVQALLRAVDPRCASIIPFHLLGERIQPLEQRQAAAAARAHCAARDPSAYSTLSATHSAGCTAHK